MPERITALREEFTSDELIVAKVAGVFVCTGVAGEKASACHAN